MFEIIILQCINVSYMKRINHYWMLITRFDTEKKNVFIGFVRLRPKLYL